MGQILAGSDLYLLHRIRRCGEAQGMEDRRTHSEATTGTVICRHGKSWLVCWNGDEGEISLHTGLELKPNSPSAYSVVSNTD